MRVYIFMCDYDDDVFDLFFLAAGVKPSGAGGTYSSHIIDHISSYIMILSLLHHTNDVCVNMRDYDDVLY